MVTPKPRVLLVDDDRACRELYAGHLRARGLTVIEAHNGHQAFAKAVEEQPDVVVTDLALPGVDGYHLAARLRGHAPLAGIPIVAITGYGGFVGDTARALAAGCDAVLTKPILPDTLLEEIERLLAHVRT